MSKKSRKQKTPYAVDNFFLNDHISNNSIRVVSSWLFIEDNAYQLQNLNTLLDFLFDDKNAINFERFHELLVKKSYCSSTIYEAIIKTNNLNLILKLRNLIVGYYIKEKNVCSNSKIKDFLFYVSYNDKKLKHLNFNLYKELIDSGINHYINVFFNAEKTGNEIFDKAFFELRNTLLKELKNEIINNLSEYFSLESVYLGVAYKKLVSLLKNHK